MVDIEAQLPAVFSLSLSFFLLSLSLSQSLPYFPRRMEYKGVTYVSMEWSESGSGANDLKSESVSGRDGPVGSEGAM